MQLLGLKDQKDIAEVIDYLVEIHQKSDTVEDVMEKFGLTPEEYRMCCNLAMPAPASPVAGENLSTTIRRSS